MSVVISRASLLAGGSVAGTAGGVMVLGSLAAGPALLVMGLVFAG